MSTAIVPRIDVLRAQLRTLLLLEQATTPGPWGLGGSCVTAAPEFARDPDDVGYYGGAMVCESIVSADALFVVAARNLMPDVATALDTAFVEIRSLRSKLASAERFATALAAENAELRECPV